MNTNAIAHSRMIIEKRTKYSGISQSLLVDGFGFVKASLNHRLEISSEIIDSETVLVLTNCCLRR